MRMMGRAARVLLSFTLALWASVLASAAIAAVNVFGALGRESIVFDRFGAVPVEEHPRLLAGTIMEGVFFMGDLVQFVAAPLALVLLLVEHVIGRIPMRSAAALIRATTVIAAAAVFGWHGLVAGPEMNRELRAYWRAAEAGDLETAAAHRAEFDARHWPAEARLSITFVLVLAAICSSGLVPAQPRTQSRPEASRS